MRSLDIDSLFLTIVNRTDHTALFHTLRCGFRGVATHLLGERSILSECLLEGCGHGVSFHQRYPLDQVIFLFLALWQFFEIYEYAEIVSLLRCRDEGAVFSFQDFLGAILYELVEALYVYADKDLRFCVWGGDVEGYVVEV